jgi:dienelactone hydrolase
MSSYKKSNSELVISRCVLNQYGNHEAMIRAIRRHRPLDLNAEIWHHNHPGKSFEAWRKLAKACVSEGLHYNPGPVALNAEVDSCEDRGNFVLEHIAFNTTAWNRVKGYFLLPKHAVQPLPALVVFHAWGGPMLFGKERVVNSGKDHPLLLEHRNKVYSGNYLAEVFTSHGYAVIVIDAHHFGERAPRGFSNLPPAYDPFELAIGDYVRLDAEVREQLYLGVRQLNWAGTTWMGVNFWDDSRCVDYLLSRSEVDPQRIGCTGLSGGGWRTNMLAALDDRIKASVSVGWMTTGDYQQAYNVAGAIGTFCLLPGVWDRLDVPDMTIMAAPNASMVVSGRQDMLFPPEGQTEAARQIQKGYDWAGVGERFNDYRPDKPHCYDSEVQQHALEWFKRFL